MNVLSSFFKDKHGKIVIWQAPNTPLVGWALCMILARIVPNGTQQDAARFVGFGFLFTWAWLEITQGDSYFRRFLGVVVMAATIYARVK